MKCYSAGNSSLILTLNSIFWLLDWPPYYYLYWKRSPIDTECLRSTDQRQMLPLCTMLQSVKEMLRHWQPSLSKIREFRKNENACLSLLFTVQYSISIIPWWQLFFSNFPSILLEYQFRKYYSYFFIDFPYLTFYSILNIILDH